MGFDFDINIQYVTYIRNIRWHHDGQVSRSQILNAVGDLVHQVVISHHAVDYRVSTSKCFCTIEIDFIKTGIKKRHI